MRGEHGDSFRATRGECVRLGRGKTGQNVGEGAYLGALFGVSSKIPFSGTDRLGVLLTLNNHITVSSVGQFVSLCPDILQSTLRYLLWGVFLRAGVIALFCSGSTVWQIGTQTSGLKPCSPGAFAARAMGGGKSGCRFRAFRPHTVSTLCSVA